jgi:hypothetical protein
MWSVTFQVNFDNALICACYISYIPWPPHPFWVLVWCEDWKSWCFCFLYFSPFSCYCFCRYQVQIFSSVACSQTPSTCFCFPPKSDRQNETANKIKKRRGEVLGLMWIKFVTLFDHSARYNVIMWPQMTRKSEHTLITCLRDVFLPIWDGTDQCDPGLMIFWVSEPCFTLTVGPSAPQTRVRAIAISVPACALQHIDKSCPTGIGTPIARS